MEVAGINVRLPQEEYRSAATAKICLWEKGNIFHITR